MKKLIVELYDGTQLEILIVRYNRDEKGKKKVYIPLIEALIDRLTEQQLKKMILNAHVYRDGTKMILDKDIMNCFELSTDMSIYSLGKVDRNITDKHCICGVKIENEYLIVNPQDVCGGALTPYMIGCECIKNWNEDEYDNIMFEKRKKEFSEIEFCKICKRKIDKKSCSCKKKYNMTLKICFNQLRSISENSGSREYLNFGKFRDMTYLQLIKSKKYIHKNYVTWILSEKYDKEDVKEKLKMYIQNRNDYKSL